jgi:integrase
LIAFTWSDVDLKKGTIRIDMARVMGRDKDTTKTALVRDVELCPRAIAVLKPRRALTGLKAEHVFDHDSGEPYHDLQIPWKRWVFAHKTLGIRYREPYQMRHTSVTWNLVIGKNLLFVAHNHGHSAVVMLKVYAKWLAGSTDKDVAKISAAMELACGAFQERLIFTAGQ